MPKTNLHVDKINRTLQLTICILTHSADVNADTVVLRNYDTESKPYSRKNLPYIQSQNWPSPKWQQVKLNVLNNKLLINKLARIKQIAAVS